jgi:MPBQ/MSBQ methyltransferase
LDDAQRSLELRDYWGRRDLGRAIVEAYGEAGADVESLTVDDLAPMDQFHGGGIVMTRRLARLGELAPGTRVLDVGGGLGGPARTLAVEFGCSVTLSDLTESYIQAGGLLTRLLRLEGSLTHLVADGLELPFASGSFDVVWTQNSGMNIADKERLYHGFHRVLSRRGRLVTQEPMAGPIQPLIFPVMWGRDASASFLRTPEEMREVIEAAGFRQLAWGNTRAVKTPDVGSLPNLRLQTLVMGDELAQINAAGRRNNAEGRIVMIQAVFEKA